MIMHSDKKVVCIREIPSNIIEEAIFILKPNVAEDQNEIGEERTKDIILSEAEDIVDEYINKMQFDVEEDYIDSETEIFDLKKEIVYIIGLLIILGICISIVI